MKPLRGVNSVMACWRRSSNRINIFYSIILFAVDDLRFEDALEDDRAIARLHADVVARHESTVQQLPRQRILHLCLQRPLQRPRAVDRIEAGFGEQIEMRVENDVVVLAPAHRTREGWDSAFAKMAAAKDDTLLLPDTMEHDWDEEEWEW